MGSRPCTYPDQPKRSVRHAKPRSPPGRYADLGQTSPANRRGTHQAGRPHQAGQAGQLHTGTAGRPGTPGDRGDRGQTPPPAFMIKGSACPHVDLPNIRSSIIQDHAYHQDHTIMIINKPGPRTKRTNPPKPTQTSNFTSPSPQTHQQAGKTQKVRNHPNTMQSQPVRTCLVESSTDRWGSIC